MVPAHGYVIDFYDCQRAPRHVPVCAWDENGNPLVAGEKALVSPDELAGLYGVDDTGWSLELDPDDTCIVVPGGGWLRSDRHPDGRTHTAPVVGWLIHERAGYGRALLARDDGRIGESGEGAMFDGGEYIFWHPDGTIRPWWHDDVTDAEP